jgi:hypothetical protein
MFTPWPRALKRQRLITPVGYTVGHLRLRRVVVFAFAFSMHDVLMMRVGGDGARVLIGTRATSSTAYALATPAPALADLCCMDVVRVEVACVHLTGTS